MLAIIKKVFPTVFLLSLTSVYAMEPLKSLETDLDGDGELDNIYLYAVDKEGNYDYKMTLVAELSSQDFKPHQSKRSDLTFGGIAAELLTLDKTTKGFRVGSTEEGIRYKSEYYFYFRFEPSSQQIRLFGCMYNRFGMIDGSEGNASLLAGDFKYVNQPYGEQEQEEVVQGEFEVPPPVYLNGVDESDFKQCFSYLEGGRHSY
ncbi:hypothetical protein [Ostreibacterium oceani]|uniref:Uncharacterized protein n=1 Tax=Ostreibacterium oceani TaxID=2654998 RepID=A0A6N7F0N8_9GAMM|nr:hypothetical protein [Ostreibacterium oceani]MPV86348.1 hypothetical protein [Ostreibacterium oceani]